MNKLLPMRMLFLGVALAAAAGSRNGDSHTDNRAALWALEEAGAGIAREADIASQREALAKLEGNEHKEAQEALTEAEKAHAARTEELKTSGFLGTTPIDAQLAAAKQLPLQVYREVFGDEPIDAIIKQMNQFTLGAARNQLEGHVGDDLDDELKAELVAAIDEARATGAIAPALFKLKAAGIEVAPPEPEQIRAEFLVTADTTTMLEKLVEAGHIDRVQKYKARLDEARVAVAILSVPPPSTRIKQWANTGGPLWFLGVLLIGTGAVLARRQIAAENAGEGGSGTDSGKVDFQRTLNSTRKRVNALSERIADLPMDKDHPGARDEIDKINIELLQPLVEQRGRFMARHGLAVFAEYFSPFAATERNLARAWSALTDGHAVVARDALGRASDSLAMADEAWKKAEAGLKR